MYLVSMQSMTQSCNKCKHLHQASSPPSSNPHQLSSKTTQHIFKRSRATILNWRHDPLLFSARWVWGTQPSPLTTKRRMLLMTK